MQYPPCTLAFSALHFQLASFLLSSAQDKFKCTPWERHSPEDTLEEDKRLSLAWPVLHCPRDTCCMGLPTSPVTQGGLLSSNAASLCPWAGWARASSFPWPPSGQRWCLQKTEYCLWGPCTHMPPKRLDKWNAIWHATKCSPSHWHDTFLLPSG